MRGKGGAGLASLAGLVGIYKEQPLVTHSLVSTIPIGCSLSSRSAFILIPLGSILCLGTFKHFLSWDTWKTEKIELNS